MNKLLSELKKRYNYCPATGLFTAIATGGNHSKAVGSNDQSLNAEGYPVLTINYKGYKAHRLAVLYMTGSLPVSTVDHIDGNKCNNSWANLRCVNHLTNMQNKKVYKNSPENYHGVYNYYKNRYRAGIRVDGNQIWLGIFSTKDEAIAARQAAEIKYNFHKNHGRVA